MPRPDWFLLAEGMHAQGQDCEALDVIFHEVDALLSAGDFHTVNEACLIRTPTLDLSLALLTITLSAAHLLPNRRALYEELEASLSITHPATAPAILRGLKGDISAKPP